MTWAPPSKVGDQDPLISRAKEVLDNYKYGADLLAEKVDGKYDTRYSAAFGKALLAYGPAVNEQIRRGKIDGPYISVAALRGAFDWTVKDQMGFVGTPAAPPPPAWRPIFALSAPGSGANNLVGPGNDVAERARDILHINHRRLNFPIGGYLGLMGGDPGLSYNEVIGLEGADLDLQVGQAIEETRQHVGDNWASVIEIWALAYSQSADGMKKAIVRLFGEGGKYAHLRSRINGLILYGDPSRCPGPVKGQRAGYNPKGWGIARYDSPQWVDDLTYSITTDGDMYACAEDDTLLAGFYAWFVKAELDLNFIEFSAALVIPLIGEYLGIAGPLLGGIFGAAGMGIISTMSGVALPFLQNVMPGGSELNDPQIVQLRKDLSASGLLSIGGITKLFKTLAALPGIQAHGAYWEPRAEFGGRTGIDVGYDIIAGYRRPAG